MGRISRLIAVAAMLVVAFPSFSPARATNLGGHVDEEEDCLEPVPEAVSVTGVTDTGEPISLDVLVLLDGVSLERGEEVMKKAAESYAPLNISIDSRYETVAFQPEEPAQTEDDIPASTSTRLLEDMKKWTFGKRPADVDVVYLLTEKDLSDAAGRADCIGGVRYPNEAFAVGENYRSEGLLLVFYKNATAKIAAHEIGHLLGAHHHYANCAEGTPGAVEEVGPTPCSLMFNFIDFLSLRMSQLEGAAVRGHAIEFASAGPDSSAIRSVAVRASISAGTATGTITSSDSACTSAGDVAVQRYDSAPAYEDRKWVDVGTGRSRRNGTFRLGYPITDGQYRVFVPEREVGEGGDKVVCAQAASAPITLGG